MISAAVLLAFAPLFLAASEEAVIRTPKPAPRPRINGPSVTGSRPGGTFLYRVPATGARPMTFSAAGLPPGLVIDSSTGIITGRSEREGDYPVRLQTVNSFGTATRTIRIVIGPALAHTPPMGWSSWFAEDFHISDRIVRKQADLLVSSGLAAHGYGWVNIDDGWAVKQGTNEPDYRGPERDAAGNLRSNGKFPDMKAMCDYVHGKGLKIGIYSSPGKLTCGGYPGSYGHEEQDARQFAAWGFDLLKYDWCSYDKIAKDKSLEELEKPYRIMNEALRKTGRDFLYSLCQYGMGQVWNWGRDVGGHLWRTGMDIAPSPRPVWETMTENGFLNVGPEKPVGPGGWNDPDFLLVGHIRIGEESLPTPLTPNEQYLQVSLWSMLSAPLLVSADLTKLDEFTLNLLTNDEVIAVDQDALGGQCVRVARHGPLEVLAKDLEDGSKAVGLFNRGELQTWMTVKWSDLRINGPRRVRDLWRQKDLGRYQREFRALVPPHGVVLVRLAALEHKNLRGRIDRKP